MNNLKAPKLAANSTLSDLVRTHIQEGILQGNYAPGQRLKESELASALGISRSPIREAMKVLNEEGLISVEPWKGLRISKLNRLQMIELFAYREVLEGIAVELACENIKPEPLRKLEDLVGDYLLSKDISLQDLSRNNQEFHQSIYEAAGNEYLLASTGTLRTLLALLPNENFRLPGRTKVILNEHRAIVDALGNRDPAAAKKAMLEHVGNSLNAHVSLIVEADLGI